MEKSELQRHDISLQVNLSAAIARVWCDRAQLQQVILNIVTNALEAMAIVTSRARVLRVSTQVHGQGDVLIAIEDFWTGFDHDSIGKLFEPFFTTKEHGMGLGLWISRTIIESQKGALTASSNSSFGARFEVVLPGRIDGLSE